MVEGFYPTSVMQALTLLAEKENGMLIAGGTDTMVVKKKAPTVIFLNRMQEIKDIKEDETTLTIGAGCVYSDMLRDFRVPEILRLAISQIAAPAIRNAGTIGGNICNASPAGDTLPVLYALSALIQKASLQEDGTITVNKLPIDSFILGIRKVALVPGEMVIGIEIPKRSYESFARIYYRKVGARNAQAIAKLSFAAMWKINGDVITDVRIAFGSVGVTVVRKPELESNIIGLTLAKLQERKQEIISEFAAYINPISDQRSTAAYRKKVCLNLLEDFLTVSI